MTIIPQPAPWAADKRTRELFRWIRIEGRSPVNVLSDFLSIAELPEDIKKQAESALDKVKAGNPLPKELVDLGGTLYSSCYPITFLDAKDMEALSKQYLQEHFLKMSL